MERPIPLPIELVLHVMTCLLPSTDAIIRQSHPVTKTLLSFTLVCREARRLANRYLTRHCVYLDSRQRLGAFVNRLTGTKQHQVVTACTLPPFRRDIDDLRCCHAVSDLLFYTWGTLKKLVIDMPLRTCYPVDDKEKVRPVLRRGFEQLVNLEEFVSIQDELYLDVTDIEHAFVWSKWPKLKKMALWNPNTDEEFWRRVAEHPSLEILVLSNSDALEDVDPKASYLGHSNRSLRVLFCTTSGFDISYSDIPYLEVWRILDPQKKMQLLVRSLPTLEEDALLDSYQHYIKTAAEAGSLWDWEGEEIVPPA